MTESVSLMGRALYIRLIGVVIQFVLFKGKQYFYNSQFLFVQEWFVRRITAPEGEVNQFLNVFVTWNVSSINDRHLLGLWIGEEFGTNDAYYDWSRRSTHRSDRAEYGRRRYSSV
jgi:hypothetical protein